MCAGGPRGAVGLQMGVFVWGAAVSGWGSVWVAKADGGRRPQSGDDEEYRRIYATKIKPRLKAEEAAAEGGTQSRTITVARRVTAYTVDVSGADGTVLDVPGTDFKIRIPGADTAVGVASGGAERGVGLGRAEGGRFGGERGRIGGEGGRGG